ncbi:uncharacterized protein DUF955 [Pantoea ananatis]|uniref:ImmA/IrrE family metallo-endopeptidase n=1 Tax=Pantoea ananas TaxID=553 RepID=UPI000DC5767B|nr:ImmA/IrrE family metallo-endopeptidase [Pantoea ananatis]RAR75221.1 uncharacterized protein DUF955 [Pantoea ananatis]
MNKQRLLGNKVNFLLPQTIWKVAAAARHKARQYLPSTTDPSIDIVRLLDKLNDTGAIFMEILPFVEMPNEYAKARPATGHLYVREDTYLRAANGIARDRFTLAHELGHLILHHEVKPEFAFSQTPSNHDFREDVEWQANEFAAWFLVDPEDKFKIRTPRDIAVNFGVSHEVAGILWRKFRENHIV